MFSHDWIVAFGGAVIGGGVVSAFVGATLKGRYDREERREARQAEKQYAVMERLQDELAKLSGSAATMWHLESVIASHPDTDRAAVAATELDKAWAGFIAAGSVVNAYRERLLDRNLFNEIAEVQRLAGLTARFVHGQGFDRNIPDRPIELLQTHQLTVNAHIGHAIAVYEQSLAGGDRWWITKRATTFMSSRRRK
jgi:hypothetical protein